MSEKTHDEEILNVFRERLPEDGTLTTKDLEEELSIDTRAIQKRVKNLNKKDKLTLDTEGKPNHWRLADTEPTAPVYDIRLGKAKRLANRASKYGRALFAVSVGVLAAAGLITSNHIFGQAVNLYLPLFDTSGAVIAVAAGVGGTIAFTLSVICLFISLTLPRVVEWVIADTLPEEE
jgi:hypothetical protein